MLYQTVGSFFTTMKDTRPDPAGTGCGAHGHAAGLRSFQHSDRGRRQRSITSAERQRCMVPSRHLSSKCLFLAHAVLTQFFAALRAQSGKCLPNRGFFCPARFYIKGCTHGERLPVPSLRNGVAATCSPQLLHEPIRTHRCLPILPFASIRKPLLDRSSLESSSWSSSRA